MNLKQQLILWRDTRDLLKKKEIQETADGRFSFVNWYATAPDREVLVRLIRHAFPESRVPVRFYSVFGDPKDCNESFSGIRIFYNGENLQERIVHERQIGRPEKIGAWEKRARIYRKEVDWNAFDLIVGYPCGGDGNNFLYVPLWFLRYVEPEKDGRDALAKFEAMETARRHADAFLSRRSQACVIASHDFTGSRTQICEVVSKVMPVVYAGKWHNTTDEMWNAFGNDKEKYLRSFRFNICPENMDCEGYTTEKIFDAFAAGCIPVYSGSAGRPADGILNPGSYVYLDPEQDPEAQEALVRRAAKDPASPVSAPMFLPGAMEKIERDYHQALIGRLSSLLKG